MKRDQNRKFKTYMEMTNVMGEVALRKPRIEDVALIKGGSYGTRKCDWLIMFFEDKTQVRIPVIQDYRMEIRMRTIEQDAKSRKKMEAKLAKGTGGV